DRLVGNVDAEILVDGDLLAPDRDRDVLIGGHEFSWIRQGRRREPLIIRDSVAARHARHAMMQGRRGPSQSSNAPKCGAQTERVRPAFIIGRRFRLVNVLAGPETIEVSTFRTLQTGDDAADEHGRLLSDNVFGSQAQDALRRDFTCNALYFDPVSEEVWDYVGGVP